MGDEREETWNWDVGRLPAPRALNVPGYQLGEELGRGGMGSVYRAMDEAGRAVAVKVLLRERMSPGGLARFEREAQLLARHRHPNVVTAHAWGMTEQACWLVCELVEGVQIDVAARTLALEARLDLLEQAARAVGDLHGQGVVHRDLKPSNLLVDARGQVKLIDFGVSTAEGLDRLTRTGQFVGTPLYAAPERIAGGAGADRPAGDVWSLGAIAYEVLTGQHPYPAEEFAQLSRRAVTTPTPPRQLEPALPAPLARVILRALDPDPARRPPDARALAQELAGARIGDGSLRLFVLSSLLGVLAAALAVTLVAVPAPRERLPGPVSTAGPVATATREPGDVAPLSSGSPLVPLAVRARELVRRGSWSELGELLAGRGDLDEELSRARGLASLFGEPPREPSPDLLPGDPVRALEEEGRGLAALPDGPSIPVLEGLERMLTRAEACPPALAGAREARRRAQERLRDQLLRLTTFPDVSAWPRARGQALVERANRLGATPERSGLQLAWVWLDFVRTVMNMHVSSPASLAEKVEGLPADGEWVDLQPALLRSIDASLRLVNAYVREGRASAPLIARAERAARDESISGLAALHLRRLTLRYLTCLARDEACDARRRRDLAVAERALERARVDAQELERSLVMRAHDKDRLALIGVALLGRDPERARREAEELEDVDLRRVLLAECALCRGDLPAAQKALGTVRQIPPGLRPYASRIQIHRRALAGEITRVRALELLVSMGDDPRPDHSLGLGLEWHTGPGLYDVLAKDGWWPGQP